MLQLIEFLCVPNARPKKHLNWSLCDAKIVHCAQPSGTSSNAHSTYNYWNELKQLQNLFFLIQWCSLFFVSKTFFVFYSIDIRWNLFFFSLFFVCSPSVLLMNNLLNWKKTSWYVLAGKFVLSYSNFSWKHSYEITHTHTNCVSQIVFSFFIISNVLFFLQICIIPTIPWSSL